MPGIRDLVKAVSPAWLQTGTAEKFLYNLGLGCDAVLEKLEQGIKLRFPGYGDPSALPYIGNDRLIPQGITETATAYATRLKAWLDDWQRAGSARAVLQQIIGYCASATPKVRTVSNSSVWDTYIAGANVSPTGPGPEHIKANANWRWDSLGDPYWYPFMWWRAWVVLYSLSGSPWAAPTATSGGGAKSGDGTCCGWAGTNGQARALTSIVALWKAAHCIVPWILVTYDGTLFDPSQSFGSSKLPNGLWGHWGTIVGGVYVAARPNNGTVSFIDGAS